MARAEDLLVILSMLSILSSPAIADGHAYVSCNGQLERALDALERDKSRRNKLEEEEEDTYREVMNGDEYRKELVSAPFEMSVKSVKVNVKLPMMEDSMEDSRSLASRWARVESCVFVPGNESLGTRLTFHEVTVSGVASLRGKPAEERVPGGVEGCEMTVRMRAVGIEFFTSPISRSRGQMRIRTESSLTEPRFASIYVYGCRSSYADEPFKRQESRYRDYPGTMPEDEWDLLVKRSTTFRGVESLRRRQLLLHNDRKESTVLREVEDIFLQAAGQTLTRYAERQLHPAIKETLMLSMGYTISYG